MPRGIAIAEPRQHLFAAAERVVVAAGPSQLTSRAVTREAGVAAGMLFAHFTNFDDFLVGYAVDRSFQIAGTVAGLPQMAGTGSVAANVTEAVLATPLVTLLTVTRLAAHRPALVAAVDSVLGPGSAPLPLQRAIFDYLLVEQRLGRLSADADADALALALVGVIHHVVLTDGTAPVAADRIRRTLGALTDLSSAATP